MSILTPHLTRVAKHISSNTTTHLFSGVTGLSINLWTLVIIVDTGGTAVTVTLQDTGAVNLFGSSVAFALPVGGQLVLPFKGSPWGNGTTVGAGLDIVTSANGPINVIAEVTT